MANHLAATTPIPAQSTTAATGSQPSSSPSIPLDEAIGLVRQVADNANGVIDNFDLLVTFGGPAIALIAVIAFVVLGREGRKTRDELLSRVEEREAAALRERTEIKELVRRIEDNSGRQAEIVRQTLSRFQSEASGLQSAFEGNIDGKILEIRSRLTSEIARLSDTLPTEIDRIILKDSAKLEEGKEALISAAEDLQAKLTEYGGDILKNAAMVSDSRNHVSDPYFNYQFVRQLEEAKASDLDEDMEKRRAEAVKRLYQIVEQGLTGGVDSNLLFNSGMAASRVELEEPALKLFTLAAYALPTASHKLALFRMQMTLGQSFVFKDHALVPSEESPDKIIENAFRSALEAASDAPLEQNEIIYAELWNMAQKVREANGYRRMLDTLLASYRARKGEKIAASDFSDAKDSEAFQEETWTKQAGKEIPSNLPGKISSIYALIGIGDWRSQYDHYLEEAFKLSSTESDMTTWRQSSLRDTQGTAARLGLMDQHASFGETYGVSSDGRDMGGLPPSMRAALEAIKEMAEAREADEPSDQGMFDE